MQGDCHRYLPLSACLMLTNNIIHLLQGGKHEEWGEKAMTSDAVWFKPNKRHDGNDIQDLLVKVLGEYVDARGYDLKRDVQVPKYFMTDTEELSHFCMSHCVGNILLKAAAFGLL